MRQPGERWRCEACQEPLIGALTLNGKVAPVELKGKDGGNVWLGRRWVNGGEESVVICASAQRKQRRTGTAEGVSAG